MITVGQVSARCRRNFSTRDAIRRTGETDQLARTCKCVLCLVLYRVATGDLHGHEMGFFSTAAPHYWLHNIYVGMWFVRFRSANTRPFPVVFLLNVDTSVRLQIFKPLHNL